MPKCIDCGKEYLEDDRYCPSCGSPIHIEMPSEAELRRPHIDHSPTGGRKRTLWFLLAFILFLGLVIAVLFISRMISTQLKRVGSGFY